MEAGLIILLLIVVFCILVLAMDEVQKRDARRAHDAKARFAESSTEAEMLALPHNICGGFT